MESSIGVCGGGGGGGGGGYGGMVVCGGRGSRDPRGAPPSCSKHKAVEKRSPMPLGARGRIRR